MSYYSRIFQTAEIDSTFYANPSKGMVLGWVRNTPKNFEFSLKLPQIITHKKQLDLSAGAEVDLVEFLDLIDPLREAGKLGPILIQLPPSFSHNKMDRLQEFMSAVRLRRKDESKFRFAIEFRNKSWLKEPDQVNDLLSRFNVARTVVDEPLLPIDLTPTADFTFIRWHGRGQRPWYNYRYSNEEIEPWVLRIRAEANNSKRKIYGYFNNHFHGYAVENSLEFLEELKIATPEQHKALTGVKECIEGKRKITDLGTPEAKLPPGQMTLGEY